MKGFLWRITCSWASIPDLAAHVDVCGQWRRGVDVTATSHSVLFLGYGYRSVAVMLSSEYYRCHMTDSLPRHGRQAKQADRIGSRDVVSM